MSIEEQIDNAIRDCAVGPDAMRWNPDLPTGSGRLLIAPPTDSGGWTDITEHVRHMLPIEWAATEDLPVFTLAVDEIKLLNSIKRDRSWWRRLARWIRRSRP